MVSAAINSIINLESEDDEERSNSIDSDEKIDSLENTISISKLLPEPIAGSISEIVTDSKFFESKNNQANSPSGNTSDSRDAE